MFIAGIIAGFIGGVVVTRVLSKPRIVEIEIPIPERDIPVQKPRMRDVRRNPVIYGRRKIM